MNFCINCGNKIDNSIYVCPHCGIRLKNDDNIGNNNVSVDDGGIVWGILGFLVPLVGIILFFVMKKDKPKSAKKAGIGALISVIMQLIVTVLLFIIFFNVTNSIVSEQENYHYNNEHYNYDNDLKFE